MTELKEYGDLARDSGAFRNIELDILEETLKDWRERPGDPHTLLELRDGRILAGFAIMEKAGNTDFTFDVKAFCVDRAYVGKGVARRLAEMLEEEALARESACILRVETSGRKEASYGPGAFVDSGFALIGHIAGFYGEGDDFFMYAKHLRRGGAIAEESAEDPPAKEESASAEIGKAR